MTPTSWRALLAAKLKSIERRESITLKSAIKRFRIRLVGVVSTHLRGVRKTVKVSPWKSILDAFKEPMKMYRNLSAARIDEVAEIPIYITR
jgi:hypothetical protein